MFMITDKIEIPPFDFEMSENKKGIIFKGNNGKLNKNIISNVILVIEEEIYIEFECDEKITEKRFNIKLSSDEWEITAKCDFLAKNNNLYRSNVINVTCKRGKYNPSENLNQYYFIEDLILTECDEKLVIPELNNLRLIKQYYNYFPNVDAYFFIKGKYDDKKIESTIHNIKHLLNYYSADMASMRINYIYSPKNDFAELTFKPISKYKNFNHEIPFCPNKPGNFSNFLISSYSNYIKYNDKIDHINNIIDYLSYLYREQYEDVRIAICCMILEIINNIFEMKYDRTPEFIFRLKNVLNNLNLDSDKLDSFFRDKNLLCNDTVVSELYAFRNQVFHGQKLANRKIDKLLSTFVTILFLKLLDIDSFMYLEIFNNELIHTKTFLTIFTKEKETTDSSQETPIIHKIEEIDGKLYYPLKDIEDIKDINENDEFKLVEYNKKQNILLFKKKTK